ncbi:hypothetical protein MY11210_008836 [Beauveria gryllotalpidicola]
MKLSLVVLATAATTVLAAPRPWCLRPGQPCWKVKRAVDALSEPAATPSPLENGAVPAVGADDVGLFASVAHDRLMYLAAQALSDPTSAYHKRSVEEGGDADEQSAFEKRWCMQNPKCWKRAVDEHGGLSKRWCLLPAEPCWKRSDDENGELAKRWCLRPGEPCWKRSIDQQGELAKRWCLRPGEPCWKAKRAAESVLNAGQEEGDAQEQDCGDDGECTVAKRHLDGLHHVARAIVEAF